MKTTYKISACILILIGIMHSMFGAISATEFNSEILWFLSTGFLLMLFGGINYLMASKEIYGFDFRILQVFNLFGFVFIAMLVLADPMIVGILALMAQISNVIASWDILRKRTHCCNKSFNVQ